MFTHASKLAKTIGLAAGLLLIGGWFVGGIALAADNGDSPAAAGTVPPRRSGTRREPRTGKARRPTMTMPTRTIAMRVTLPTTPARLARRRHCHPASRTMTTATTTAATERALQESRHGTRWPIRPAPARLPPGVPRRV